MDFATVKYDRNLENPRISAAHLVFFIKSCNVESRESHLPKAVRVGLLLWHVVINMQHKLLYRLNFPKSRNIMIIHLNCKFRDSGFISDYKVNLDLPRNVCEF